MVVQESLFPFGSPTTVLLHLARITRRVEKLQQDLTPQHCIRQLSDLALLESLLDVQEHQIQRAAEELAKRRGLLV